MDAPNRCPIPGVVFKNNARLFCVYVEANNSDNESTFRDSR